MFGRIAACLLLMGASSAKALEYEVLFEHGDWRVDVNMHEDGTLECEALTASGAVTMSLYESHDGFFSLSFYSPGWSFPQVATSTTFLVAVDYRTPWSMNGSRSGSAISIAPDPADDQLRRFLSELRNGRRVALANAGGDEIASFSLSGSAATLAALGECAAAIRETQPADPFASQAAAADPFR